MFLNINVCKLFLFIIDKKNINEFIIKVDVVNIFVCILGIF